MILIYSPASFHLSSIFFQSALFSLVVEKLFSMVLQEVLFTEDHTAGIVDFRPPPLYCTCSIFPAQ